MPQSTHLWADQRHIGRAQHFIGGSSMKKSIAIFAFAFAFVAGLPAYGCRGAARVGISRESARLQAAGEDGVPRRVPGSTRDYSVTQLRDRFIAPVWHPGRASAAARSRCAGPQARRVRVRILPSRGRAGRARERESCGSAGGLPRAADGGLQERRAEDFGRQAQRRFDDFALEADDRRRNRRRRRLFLRVKAARRHQGRRDRHRAEDIHHVQSSGGPAIGRKRADRQTHRRSSRSARAIRESRYARAVHRVRAARQRCERRSAGKNRRRQDRSNAQSVTAPT